VTTGGFVTVHPTGTDFYYYNNNRSTQVGDVVGYYGAPGS